MYSKMIIFLVYQNYQGRIRKRAYDIYGIPVAYVRGKLTKKKKTFTVIGPMSMMKEKVQSLNIDVMHVDSHKFLVIAVEPLQLTIHAPLVNETEDQSGLGLQGHLNHLHTRGFNLQ
jgi:hypothetical protein